ncbi:MAG: hypothetical protein IPH27_06450 [Actinomycetales bacterium]|nr:hypothetical protein [Candidatus Phosphoribacter baldrii]MBP8881833.1 hypothetical protein [Dermatophilaceae bacterium]
MTESLAVIAILVSVGSLYFAWKVARSTEAQAEIQRQIRIDAAQPFVFADIRPHQQHGSLLMFVVGNTGPTVATDVRISLHRPLPAGDFDRALRAAHAIERGISALTPGQTVAWTLGTPWKVLEEVPEGDASYRFTVSCNGPFGPVPPMEYTVDLDDIRHSHPYAAGTLHGVAEQIKSLREDLARQLRELRPVVAHPYDDEDD